MQELQHIRRMVVHPKYEVTGTKITFKYGHVRSSFVEDVFVTRLSDQEVLGSNPGDFTVSKEP